MITEEMKMAMDGIVPSALTTCSGDGVPNCSYISQVYFVDDRHVALSHQFFNKSIRNILENPKTSVSIIHPETFKMWKLDLIFSHSETEGNIFEQMEAQLEAIASMTGMEDVFKLKSSVIFEIKGIQLISKPIT